MQGNNNNNNDGTSSDAAAESSNNNNNNNNNNNISSDNNNNNDENNISNNDSSNGNYSQSVTTTATAVAVAVVPPTMAAPQQQQWLPMQYPPAFVVPHHMIPPPHYPPQYMPYHPHHLHHPPQPPHHHQIQQQQQQQGRGEGGSNGDNKTIWVGDLQDWMDEEYLRSCFSKAGEVSVKVIRNKQTGTSEGYGFVEFPSHAAAENVLQTYSCIVMPNADNPFRLNWATFSTGDKRGSNNGSDLSIFVGDLAADVTDSILLKTFSSKFPSVKGAKVVIDPNTGRSKGYGFVRFGDENEKKQAMIDMQGVYCLTRAMRIGPATPRKSSGYQQQYSLQGGYYNGSSVHGSQFEGESSNNTTIFVGGLDPNVSDKDLRQPFSQYGEIISVKIPPGKGCGFVQFVNKNDAEEALDKLNGTIIGKQTVRLSWGRNPGNKQSRADFGNQWTGAYYGGGHFYDGYGYALPPPHDPGMYAAAAAAYGAYPMYGTHQQQVS